MRCWFCQVNIPNKQEAQIVTQKPPILQERELKLVEREGDRDLAILITIDGATVAFWITVFGYSI